MATKKVSASRNPVEVILRSYNVGFGDCFLLTFRYPNFRRNVLIDFGSTRAPTEVAQQPMPTRKLSASAQAELTRKNLKKHMLSVAEQIKRDCDGKLHAVVVTHRHKDHLSGFAYEDGKGPGAIIRSLEPDLVIQPWTEDPKAQYDATRPTKKLAGTLAEKRTKARRQHLASLHNMNLFAGYVISASKKLGGSYFKDIRDQLSFLGDDNELANRDAVTNLMKMGKRKRYVYFGAKSGLDGLLPGVATHVLGPPTLEQTRSIMKQRSKDPEQFWHLWESRSSFWAHQGRIANHAAADGQTLFPQYVQKKVPWDARWYAFQAKKMQAENLLSIVRTLDSQMNNTSVILLFEVGGKSLLFPGDAQYENWMYALSDKETVKKLAKVDLYKVGHHGSLNATPKDLWNGFSARGNDRKKGRLISVLSTSDHVHGRESSGTEVPRKPLVEALKSESSLHDTRRLSGDQMVITTTLKL